MIEKVTGYYKSPIGLLEIQFRNNKIYSIIKTKKKQFFVSRSKCPKEMFILKAYLDKYFLKGVSDKQLKNRLSFHLRGTDFQKKVWKVLRKIPYGQTRTYSQVAEKVGSPGAARAVGSACAKNPFLILVPCHRVVAQQGLGGFGLGLSKKSFLLTHEQSKK